MRSKIQNLCELQLTSIVSNAEKSVEKVTDSSSKALELSAQMINKIDEPFINENELREMCEHLQIHFNQMMVNLQFFDEFTQRIDHVKKLLLFLDKNLSDKDEEKILEKISSIFSIQSEYEVLRKIFPQFQAEENIDAIELF